MRNDITDLTTLKIKKLFENQNTLTDRDLRKQLKDLLLNYREEILYNNEKYTRKLEEDVKDVKDFRLVKQLLK